MEIELMTENEIQKFILDNYETMKNKDLIARCGICQSKFYKVTKSLGLIKKPQKHWTKEEDDTIITMWPNFSKKDIMKVFAGRSYNSLIARAQILNVSKNKDTLSHYKLISLLDNTEEAHYWIGLLMADGHFSKNFEIKLTLSEKDKSHVEKFAKALSVNVNKNKSVTYKGYVSSPSYSVAVRDSYTMKILIDRYSLSSNKTENPCNISSIISEKLFLAWFVGFFDGDGCVVKNKKGAPSGLRIQVHGSWIDNLQLITDKLLKDFGIVSRSYIDTQGYARLVCWGKVNLDKIKAALNDITVPFIHRKLGLL
jgi:intein-encoded DNA endonuclease-like protein